MSEPGPELSEPLPDPELPEPELSDPLPEPELPEPELSEPEPLFEPELPEPELPLPLSAKAWPAPKVSATTRTQTKRRKARRVNELSIQAFDLSTEAAAGKPPAKASLFRSLRPVAGEATLRIKPTH